MAGTPSPPSTRARVDVVDKYRQQRNRPDPDINFKHVHVGVNGPESRDVFIFHDIDDAKRSWLFSALTIEDWASVMSQVDFSRQMLVVFTAGKRQNATSNIFIDTMYYSSESGSLAVRG